MFARILLAVDGSGPSDRAVELVKQLASQSESDVLVLHVREMISTRSGLLEARIDDEGIAERVAATLRESRVSAHPRELPALHGLVANKIVAAAEAHHADLIAMGTRGSPTWAACSWEASPIESYTWPSARCSWRAEAPEVTGAKVGRGLKPVNEQSLQTLRAAHTREAVRRRLQGPPPLS